MCPKFSANSPTKFPTPSQGRRHWCGHLQRPRQWLLHPRHQRPQQRVGADAAELQRDGQVRGPGRRQAQGILRHVPRGRKVRDGEGHGENELDVLRDINVDIVWCMCIYMYIYIYDDIYIYNIAVMYTVWTDCLCLEVPQDMILFCGLLGASFFSTMATFILSIPAFQLRYLEPWHADVYDFIELRKNHGKEEQRARDLFLALWIPDLFMKRVKQNEEPQ